MSALHRSRIRFSLLALACWGLSACSSFTQGPDVSRRIANMITPYKIDIVQGNVVTREQVAMLKPGMSRLTVRDVLGTPLLTSVFHADRWDFVFTLRRQGAPLQSRKVTIYFKGDVMDHVEADELPSESEFVSTLRAERRGGPVPPMQATEEALKKFPPPKPPASGPADIAAPVDYPPLESSSR